MEVDDFLEHHGVKGMKWGKHKAGSSSGGSGSSNKSSKATSPARQAKQEHKVNLKAARKELYSGINAHKKALVGKTLAVSLLGAPAGSAFVGTSLMRSAGYSKGKSLAVGLLGGYPGAALAVELKARKMANA